MFDEATMMHALQVWATAPGAEHQRLAELSLGFLTRQKSFHCYELKKLGFTKSIKLQKELSAHGQEGIDWFLDEINFKSYSDFGAVFKSTAKEEDDEVSTRAILISDGGLASAARPVESESHLFREMGSNPVESVNRLYFHRQIAEPVQKIVDGF